MDSELTEWLISILRSIWLEIRIEAGYENEMRIEKLFFDKLNIFIQLPRE